MGTRQPEDAPMYYDTHVFFCTNRRADGHPRGCCAAGGAEKLRDYMKARAKELGLARLRINTAGCLDRCEHGPCVLIYPEGVWYHVDLREAVDAVLEAHIRDGRRAALHYLPPETR